MTIGMSDWHNKYDKPMPACLLILMLVFTVTVAVWMPRTASAARSSVRLKPSYLLIDATSGAVLEKHHALQPHFPASLVKIMTLFLVFDALKNKQLTLEQKITASDKARAVARVRLGVKKGEFLTISAALQAVITRSANDVAVMLAESLDQKDNPFINQMNQQAKALGMSQTVFKNATGLPDKGQMTSARDMVLLARALFRKFPERWQLFSQKGLNYRGKYYSTYNGFLGKFSGGDGIKTGFTCASGYNLAASAVRDGRRLLAVVLGGESAWARDKLTIQLMEKGFQSDKKRKPKLYLHNLKPKKSVIKRHPPDLRKQIVTCNGHFPSNMWGIEFGRAYWKRSRAMKHAHRVLAGLRASEKTHRIWPVSKKLLGRYSAVLVGFKAKKAQNICKRIAKQNDGWCLTLNPTIIRAFRKSGGLR